mmetsp:Transcript_10697/g.14860  ORF Transcript_10697/g.14860 Transcript_10697/m.14860 type:complete len:167 (+) Transcript_10697:96-596(+)|eukprot:CAMPEP_0184492738 /NCGR_PEP_ID=MMETSP0113_2-20130426/24133_1 /TAXON_ID=91329 /ORGANISM="Norrisiella sphaerica, Strain BC52" /LENGTH=166 /DNA_ID=CAMNT_0026877707 /DNA_START=68 /DNA_END=568 /DNA_ORIENTATION=+
MVRGNAKVKSQAKRLKKLEAERKAQGHSAKAVAKARAAAMKFVCPDCKTQLPNLKNAMDHFGARHPKSTVPADWQRLKEEELAELKAIEEEKKRKKREAANLIKKNNAIRACLMKFYEAHAPDKVGNIDKIMSKYDGKWDKLEAGLAKNYGDDAPKITEAIESALK